MKKRIWLILFLMLLTGCSKEDRNDYKRVQVASDYITYSEVNSIEDASDLVIIGTFVGETQQELKMEYSGQFGKDILVDATSFANVRVDQVFKGDVEIGDTIQVSQSYGYVDDTEQLVCFSSMTPMVKGDRWIFFLGYSEEAETYWCSGDYTGRYPVPEDLDEDIYNHILQVVTEKKTFLADKEPLPKLEEGEKLDETKKYFWSSGLCYVMDTAEDIAFYETWQTSYQNCLATISLEDFGLYEGSPNLELYVEILEQYNLKPEQ